MRRRDLVSGAVAVAAMAALPRDGRAAVVNPPALIPTPNAQRAYRIACRQRPVSDGTDVDSTNNSMNIRVTCFAPKQCDISDIRLSFPGFGFNIAEVDLPNGFTVTSAVVEYPIGTFTKVYAAGNPSLTVTPGRSLYHYDPAPIQVPAGANFFVKAYITWTGTLWLNDKTGCYGTGEWCERGVGLADQTLTTSVRVSAGHSGFAPIVYARLSKSVACLGLFGDSITQTAQDRPDPITSSQWSEGAMLGQVPVINLSRSSDGANTVLLRNEGRNLIALDSVTHVHYGYGRNSLSLTPGVITANQDQLQKLSAHWMAEGKKVGASTVTPFSHSTDGWSTTAGQTNDNAVQEGNRILYNNWLRANWQALGLSWMLDWAHVVDPTDSGLWNVDVGHAGSNAAGFPVLSSGAMSSVTLPNYHGLDSASGISYPNVSADTCYCYAYPGDPGSGGVVTYAASAGVVTSFAVASPGSGYLNPPMVAPIGAWTRDGIHPTHRGYMEIIRQTGWGPAMLT